MSEQTKSDTAALEISRADAEIILNALIALKNMRQFGAKEAAQDPRELYGDVADAIDRFREQARRAFESSE